MRWLHRRASSVLYAATISFCVGLVLADRSAASSTVEIHYTFTGEQAELAVLVVMPDGTVTNLEPQGLPGMTRFVYEDDGVFTDYHKNLVFKFAWSKLPANHSVALRGPVEFQLPARLRRGQDANRVLTFSLYRSFNYRVAANLDDLTAVDIGRKLVNAALGAKYFGGSKSKTATNWARIWFDAALQLTANDRDDFFQLGDDAVSNFRKRLSDEGGSALWGRIMEARTRFVRVDGLALDRSLGDGECDRARAIYEQLVKKNVENRRYFAVARPNEKDGYYLSQKRDQVAAACE